MKTSYTKLQQSQWALGKLHLSFLCFGIHPGALCLQKVPLNELLKMELNKNLYERLDH